LREPLPLVPLTGGDFYTGIVSCWYEPMGSY
jgi:hypothetical protein